MKLFDQLENIDQDIVTHFNSHKEVVNKVLPHVIGLLQGKLEDAMKPDVQRLEIPMQLTSTGM